MKRLARPWVSWTTLGMLTLATASATPRLVRGTDGPTLAPATTEAKPASTTPPAVAPTTPADETPLPLDLDLVPIPAEPTTPPAPAETPLATDSALKPLAPASNPAVLRPVPSAADAKAPATLKVAPSTTPVLQDPAGIVVPGPVDVSPSSTRPPTPIKPKPATARLAARPTLPLLQPRLLAPAPRFAGEVGVPSPVTIAAPGTAVRPTAAPVETVVANPAPSISVPEPTAPVPVALPDPASRNEHASTPSLNALRAPGGGVRSIPVTSTVPLALEPKLAPTPTVDPAPTRLAEATPETNSVPVLKAPAIATTDGPSVPKADAPSSVPGAKEVADGAKENGSVPLTVPTLPGTPASPTPETAPALPSLTAPKSTEPKSTEPKSTDSKSTDSSGAGSEVREPKNVPAVPNAPLPMDVAKPATPADQPQDKPAGDAAKPKPAEAAPEKPRDPLLALVDQAIEVTSQRQLRVGMNSPWQIVHGVVALRWDMRIQTQDGKGSVSAIEYLMAGNTYENQPIWQETAWGGRGHPYTRPYAHEGHPTQFLGYMTMANIPLDYEIKTPNKIITVRDVINDAKMQVRQGPEITWTLWALAHYEESDAQWLNNANEPWSIERLVKLQVDERVTNSACGGCHGMFALCYARNLYFTTGKPLSGVWMEADQKIKWYTEATRRMQNTDGSFSSNFYKGPGYSNDYDTRLNTTGHQLEWILVSLPQSRLGEPWVRRAVESLSRDLITNARFPAECGPMYHSLHALILYRQRLDPKYRVPKRNSPLKLVERELTKGNTIAAPQPGAVRR